jgi:hypothetical protein
MTSRRDTGHSNVCSPFARGSGVDDAMAFPRPASAGLPCGQEGGKIPAMLTLLYAGGPAVPGTHQQEECRVGTARRLEVFRYLGRLLSQDDDDNQAVQSQLRKSCKTGSDRCCGERMRPHE